MIGDGVDQQFDTGDDVVIGISNFGYIAGSQNLTLTLAQSLPTDRYRLTLLSRTGQALVDQAGNRLDGDANGTAGGDFVRVFFTSTAVGSITDINASPDQVPENSATGTPVGVTAQAVDPDAGDVVTYSLDDNAGGRFAIHPNTGVVTVANGTLLDREATASHSITIRATSSDGSFSTVQRTIAVLDVDEFDVGPVIDVNSTTNEVSENSATGTLVGITASASDADATTNAITYSLTNNAGGRFAINPVTGIVTVANGSLIDREQAALHNITVRATSADGSFSDQVFTINVLDIDEFNVGPITDADAAPDRVSQSAAVGTPAGITAFAVDPDATNNAITYTLDNSAGGRFAIHPTTGVVTVAGPLTPGTPSYDIIVRATSQDGSVATRTFTIVVPQAAPGDFDGDGDLDISDVDALSAAIATHSTDLLFDVTGDGQVTFADLQHWILDIKGTLFGDSNLDFVIDGQDFIILELEQIHGRPACWSHGDFNADGVVDGQDFIIWNTNKFMTATRGQLGDFDGDGDLDGMDVDALSTAIATGWGNLAYDVNRDGQLTLADLQYWVLDIKRSVIADSNLDLVVDGQDFIVWNSNKFAATSFWSRGNFNADGVVDGQDFILWNTHKFTTATGGQLGDFDGDGDLDTMDLDALSTAIATGSGNLAYDVNQDGQLTLADLQYWVLDIKRSVIADSNLDFVVDGQDFIVWNSNKFAATSLWSRGDFNADGMVDGQDFILWNTHKFQSASAGILPVPAVALRPLTTDFIFAGVRGSRVQHWSPDQAADDYFAQLE